MELAGVWSEAAPLGGFGVPGELLCSAFNHSSCTPGPERRARPSLLPPHQLSATPARLRAKPGGPVHRNASQGEGSHPTRAPSGRHWHTAPCSGKNPARGRAGAPLQAWIHIQRPRKPPTLCRLTGEAPARRACRGSLAPADPVSLQAWVHPQHPHRLPALFGQTGDPRLKCAPDPACFVLSQPAGGLCGAVCGLGVRVRLERADPPADFKFHVFTRLRGGGRYL